MAVVRSEIRYVFGALGGFFVLLSYFKMEKGVDDLKTEEEKLDVGSKEKQSARSFLRERFLRSVTGLVGKECSFHMYSNTNVEGVFKGSDIEFENLLVDNLKTPVAEIPHSKIRSNDVNYMVFKNFLNSS